MPVHDDRLLFEFLILEGAQAGLSWETILKKRENYREAFDQFVPALVAKYGQKKRQSLLTNPGIIRNKLKIETAVQNAKAFLAVQKEFGNFDKYIWRFVDQEPKQNARKSMKEVPAKTPESDALSKDLKKRWLQVRGQHKSATLSCRPSAWSMCGSWREKFNAFRNAWRLEENLQPPTAAEIDNRLQNERLAPDKRRGSTWRTWPNCQTASS